MKKQTFFLLASILLFNLFSQAQEIKYGINDTIHFEPAKGLKEYYKSIYEAEMEFINGNKEEAVKNYIKAFGFKDFPFSRDHDRAITLALEINDTNLIKPLLIIWFPFVSIEPETYLHNLSSGMPNIDTIFLYGLSPYFDSVPKLKNQKEIRNILDSLCKEDQRVRQPEFIKENGYDEMQIVDSLNFIKLMSLYNKYGFISSENLGYWGNYNNDIWLLLCHNPDKIDIWYPLMFEQVSLGYYPSPLFLELLENYYYKTTGETEKKVFSLGQQLFDTYCIIKLSKEEEAKLNIIRDKLFLEPYLNQERKRIWYFFLEDYNLILRFNFYNLGSSFPSLQFISDEEEIEKYKQKQADIIQKLKEEHGHRLIVIDKAIYEKGFDIK